MAHRLRDLRTDRDLKQADLALVLNISQTTYSKYELGKIELTESMIILLSQFYKVSTDYLLGLSNKKER